jgi:hypothetical protein
MESKAAQLENESDGLAPMPALNSRVWRFFTPCPRQPWQIKQVECNIIDVLLKIYSCGFRQKGGRGEKWAPSSPQGNVIITVFYVSAWRFSASYGWASKFSKKKTVNSLSRLENINSKMSKYFCLLIFFLSTYNYLRSYTFT